jgi:predicted dehydrogenase
MRIGVIGLGSMGKRRVRDLLALGCEVIGFDVRADRVSEANRMFRLTSVSTFEELLALKPEALVISVPPDEHLRYYERSFAAGLPFFSEMNVLTPESEWFAANEHAAGVRSYPSGTWQFYPLFQILREELNKIGFDHINSVHYHYGGYLPFWHPWEHYKDFYAGRDRRVCAAREMVPFELEWLRWVFGTVKAVCCMHGRRAEWITDIDDSYSLMLEFDSGLFATMNIELHQVAPFRLARVACRKNSFTLDMVNHELRRYDLETDSWKIIKPPGLRSLGSFDFEQIYFNEMRAFADALAGRAPFPKTWADDRHLSDVLVAAEQSWKERGWVTVKEVEKTYDGRSWVVNLLTEVHSVQNQQM